MNDVHLTEAELLDVAEGVAGEAARAHAAACPQCGAAVADAERGKHVLQSAAPLEAPPRLTDAIAGLPQRSRPRRRLLTIAAPAAIAVAGAIAAAVVLTTGGGTPTMHGGETGAAPLSAGGAAREKAAPAAARSVAGPATAVAEALRRAGFKAVAKGPSLVVVHGDAAAVARALARRPNGAVRVDVRP